MKWDRFKPKAETLKLYGYWRSSNSWRVRWALELKGIAYEYIPVNLLTGENKQSEHLARHPLGFLPVIEVNQGLYLAESLAIIEWIEEVYSLQGPSFFPGTPLERAKIRELAETINADVMPLQSPRVQKRHSADAAEQKAWAAHFVREGLKAFEVLSRGTRQRYSFFDTLSLADLCLVPQIYNALRFDIDVAQEFSDLWGIYERCLASEACRKAAPESQSDAPKKS